MDAAERGPVAWHERAKVGTLPPDAHGARAFWDRPAAEYAEDARAILRDRADYDDCVDEWLDRSTAR